MALGFESFVGLRYLMAKRQRNVLSVITLISVAGVAVGVMALIVVLSVMGGFEGDLREKIIGAKAHIVISAEDGYLEDYDAILEQVEGVDGVIGASPYVEGEVMVNSASNLQGVVLRGIDVERIGSISNLPETIEKGGLEYLEEPDELEVDRGIIIHKDPEDPGASADDMRRHNARSTLTFSATEHARFVDGALASDEDGDTPPRPDLQPVDPDADALDRDEDGSGPEDGEARDASPDDDGTGTAEPTPDSDAIDDDVLRSRVRPDDPFLAEIDAQIEAEANDDQAPADPPASLTKPADEDPFLAEIDAEKDDVWVDGSEPELPDFAGDDSTAGLMDDDDARPTTSTLSPRRKPKRQMKPIPYEVERQVGGVIIGRELRDNLAVFLGHEVNLMSPMGDIGPTGSIPKSRPYRVVGEFYSGMYEFDTKYVYTTLENAQNFLGIDERVTGIEVKIDDMERSPERKAAIEAALADFKGVQVQDWRELNGNLFSALMLEKIAMFVILTFIILVASFSILCLLIMIVIEKGREIAIFKAMGASTTSIMRVFVIQGGVIGMLGTAIGCTLGLLLCWVIAGWGIELPADVYYLSHVPVEVRPAEVAVICGAAVLISLLATLPPSVLAARLDPVEGLRHD